MFDPFTDIIPPPPPAQAQPSFSPTHALLEGLNLPQAQAVQTTEGPLLVLAGAGTGKTSVLTRRIAYMLLTQSAQPHQILAVTFTNKAAKEMAERTEKLVGHSVAGMWLGTFHRLGNRFLRQHAELVGLRPDFVILDTDDQLRLLTEIAKDLNLNTEQFPPRLLASIISRHKDNALTPEALPPEDARALGGRGQEVYTEYQTRLARLNAVDFGDLLLHPLTILQTNQALQQTYQTRFRYILVDEYQDTNGVQYQWLKLLAAQHKNICVVGDDDQSIYAWRGAQVGNILNFETDFPGAQTIRLEQNYRSTGHILAAANAVIANNRQRHGKNLWTDAGHGTPLELHAMLDDREEARFVADEAQRHWRARGNLNDIAVLVRTTSQTRGLEEQFMKAGIPYTMVGGLRFYERREIKDAIAYLRLIHNPRDDLAFQRIVNVPRRGVGETTLAQLSATASSWRSNNRHIPTVIPAKAGIQSDTPAPPIPSLFSAAQHLTQTGELTGKAASQLAHFVAQVERWRSLQAEPANLLELVLEESGYAEMLRNDKSKDDGQDAKARLDNLKELLRALSDYPDLQSFLDHVSLVADADSVDDADTVKMMTIHAAKGLEYPLVFLPGFEEGIFPHQRALNEEGQKGLEEERRLAYVAITRAKHRCVISYAHGRRMWGQYLSGAPSRFLTEIPPEHLKRMDGTSFNAAQTYRPVHGFVPKTPPPSNHSTAPTALSKHAHTEIIQNSNTPTLQHSIATGDKVHHAKFGPGIVLGTEGTGEAQTITIAFKHAGTKKLLATLAKLTKA